MACHRQPTQHKSIMQTSNVHVCAHYRPPWMESLPYRTQLSPPLLSHAATLMLLCAVTFSSLTSTDTTAKSYRRSSAGSLHLSLAAKSREESTPPGRGQIARTGTITVSRNATHAAPSGGQIPRTKLPPVPSSIAFAGAPRRPRPARGSTTDKPPTPTLAPAALPSRARCSAPACHAHEPVARAIPGPVSPAQRSSPEQLGGKCAVKYTRACATADSAASAAHAQQ